MDAKRIVPVSVTDLLSLYKLILSAAGVTVTAVNADDVEGNYSIDSNPSGSVFCAEPVKAFAIGSSVTAFTAYFVAGYDFEGFGEATVAGVDVVADDKTLYKAILADGTVTVSEV